MPSSSSTPSNPETPVTFRRRSFVSWLALAAVPWIVTALPAAADDEEETDEPLTYEDVVTEDAITDTGVFDVHRVEERLLFEIPNERFGRDFLLVSRIARVPADLAGGFMAAGHKAAELVVRFERMRDRVLLRKVSYRNVADPMDPIYRSVVNNNFFPILAAFAVEVESPDSTSVVIDVTEFFESDVPAVSGLPASIREEYEVGSLDKDRSFINDARAFPENVNVRHTLTYEAKKPPVDADTKTLSLEMVQSMIQLPETPMRVRFADSRLGWFTIRRTNYGLDEQKAAEEEILQRWRLEPSDPAAYARGEAVDPVEPIVYYLDPATPAKWRPYVRQGVEDWQAVFESAGFRDAILARDAPTPEEDPEWSTEDVRYSVVRWAANGVRNAMGPSVADPRSGEILESDIVWYHNHMRSYRNRLLVETGAANPLARSLPIDDDLLGEAIRQVIAHEVGHALGLPHNMAASAAFPVDSLRSPTFCRSHGVSASIMEYARQNYVAQPEDGLSGADFIRRMGPYDHYAINWGYRVIPVPTPEAEKAVLDGWIRDKAGDPLYRYGPQRGGLPIDPRTQIEDLSDDPVRASGYGILNLKRVVPNLIAWTSTPGEDYADLEELYGEVFGHYSRLMSHVVAVVGGVTEDLKATDQPGRVYAPVPAERQRAAMTFLTTHVFDTPAWLLDADILRRIQHAGDVERLRAVQARTLHRLLDPSRMQRLVEAEAALGERAYGLAPFLEDARRAVWGRWQTRDVGDPYRRALQRTHVERLMWLMAADAEEEPVTPVHLVTSDIRPLVRAQLEDIAARCRSAASRGGDAVIRAHHADVSARIAAFLEGRPLPGGET